MATLEIRGSGDESVVYVHGTPSDRRVWEDLSARAPVGVATVLVDLPDHGEAPDEPTASMAPLEAAVLEAVGQAPGDVTLVGHSVGAWLVATLSSRMPARVRRIVPICGMSRFTDEGLAMRRDLVGALERREVEPGDVREQILALMLGQDRSPELDARLAPMVDLSRERWIRLVRRCFEINDRPPASIERPATVVHASGDAVIPLAWGAELARRSNAQLVTIDTTSHMIPLTHAGELAKLIYRRG